ncbi:MAG: hypothetical protein COA42_18615 [Alteromonadaceae bacterium]|nr:MAG: hypothetical protein COA42_18615 [Alteromonadaceae bacterium]
MNRYLSTAERKLIAQLYNHLDKQPQRFKSRYKKTALPIQTSLINGFYNIAAIPHLAPLTLHPEKPVANQALVTLSVLIKHVSDTDLAWLDEGIRSVLSRCRYQPWMENWQNIRASDVAIISCSPPHLSTLLVILCCHNNGYVREAALQQLLKTDQTLCIRMAYIRANDWVSGVSHTALQILIGLLPQLEPKVLASTLLLLDQLRLRRRRNHSELVEKVELKLQSERGLASLIDIIKQSDFRLARSAYKLAASFTKDIEPLLIIGKKHSDSLIRYWALDLGQQFYKGDALLQFIRIFCNDTLAPLRKKALYALIDEFPQQSTSVLKMNLAHENKGIREIACFYLKKQIDEINISEYYRSTLKTANENELYGLISGLAETGDSSDWKLIKDYEYHHRPKVRKAVILSTLQLMKEPQDWLHAKLASDTPAEVAAAATTIRTLNNANFDTLEELYHRNVNNFRGRAILKIIERGDKWLMLKVILQSCCNATPDSAEATNESLRRWHLKHGCPHYYVKPDNSFLDLLLDLSTLVSDEYSQSSEFKETKDLIVFLRNLTL